MRTLSIACLVGLCLSFAAIACDGEDVEQGATAEATEAAPTPAPTSGEAPAPTAPAPDGDDDEPTAPAPPADSDAGVPYAGDAGDAGDAGPKKPTIPKPNLPGTLHAETSKGDMCIFSVDGQLEDTGTSLDINLVVGDHTVACERGDGTKTSKAFVIESSKTTNVVLDFKEPVIPPPTSGEMGTLVAIVVGGSCAFTVDGAPKGSGATIKVPVKAGTYTVACKPASGATKQRDVTVSPGGTGMAMFKL